MKLHARVRIRNLGLALLLAFSLGVSLYSGDSLRFGDENDYEQLARSLLHDHTFAFAGGNPTAYRPPAYPAFIAAAHMVVERLRPRSRRS